MSEQVYELNAPQIAAELLDGEVMAINFQDGLYFSLRGSAAAIWALITAHHSLSAVSQQLEPHLPNASALVPDFVRQLEAQQLIRPCAAATPKTVDLQGFALPWQAPQLEQFDDMQMLLLIDPIHEVDSKSGWPYQK
jgi:hypothetical protein